MPAAALPPPTSPYLQALERASGIIKQQQQASASSCGNATRASQAYCSSACRDSDNLQRSISDLRATGAGGAGHHQQQEILNDDLLLYTEQLQLSPMLSPAVHAVPALVPSASSRKNRSGTTTPIAHASSSAAAAAAAVRRSSSNRAQADGQQVSNRHTIAAMTSSAGEGSSSSPPSSSATSSPTKTATDDDRIEEDIENLLLPPPIGTGLDKKTAANNAFDYAYPYGIRAGTAVVVPKSPTSTKTQPHRTATNQANTTAPITSTGMRKSSSQQSNRLSKQQPNMMLSPIFAPKSVGATASSAGGLLQDGKSRSGSRPNTGSSSNTTHDNSNTPPVDPSEVITFRRRHHAPDSINGHQKSSHGSGNVSTTTSSSASPALHALNSSTSSNSSKSASRRHSTQGSQITSPKMVPAFSPLVKARSTTSKTIPTLKDIGNSTTAASPSTTTTSTSSPLIKPVDGQGITASPSLAATSLSDLLHRTSSRPESSTHMSASQHQQQQQHSVATGKRASKSDTVLGNTLGGHAPLLNGIKEASTSNKATWLQRNKLTKNFFSFNAPSSTLSRIGAAAAGEGEGGSALASHATCGRKNCPVNHQTSSHQHPLASFFTPLSRRVTEPVSPFASPAIYYADYPKDPFEESFASRSASDSITATLRNTSLSPTSPAGLTGYDSSSAGVSGVRRRPSLSTSITSPAVITTPSPGPGGIRPQDHSGFAGFLFALHNQRKANAAASQQQAASTGNSHRGQDATAVPNGKKASFELYDTPESSESGYDAQDEQVSAVRGRGRTSGRRAAMDRPSTAESSGTLFKSEEQAHIAKPALLKEKLAHVVRASNDRPSSSISSNDSVEATNTAAVSPARSSASGQQARPTRFLFGRGNAFKTSNLNDTTLAETDKAVQGQTEKNVPPPPRLRHNHSTSVGEGSQYIVSLRGQSEKESKLDNDDDDDTLSEEILLNEDRNSPSLDGAPPATEARGRPTARRRSSANGRLPLVSPFTTLDRISRQMSRDQVNEEGGRGRSRARGSAALHRSVSPARSSSRARGRDSPRLRMR